MAVCGHEDKHLRFFDINSCSCVKDLVGHTDSVSSLWMSGNYLVSGGHDGSLRFWDVRTYQCLQEIPAHRKKYDEGVLCICQHPSFNLMASAGADSLVKLYNII
jgi:striatin 1/3/4